MIKDSGGKFDDCSISPKIQQILMPWSSVLKIFEYLLQFPVTEFFIFFYCIKDELLSVQQKRNIAKSKGKLF